MKDNSVGDGNDAGAAPVSKDTIIADLEREKSGWAESAMFFSEAVNERDVIIDDLRSIIDQMREILLDLNKTASARLLIPKSAKTICSSVILEMTARALALSSPDPQPSTLQPEDLTP